jgi:hypothetical protein
MIINTDRVTAIRALRAKCLAAHLLELYERSNAYGSPSDVAKWQNRLARVNRWSNYADEVRWQPVH